MRTPGPRSFVVERREDRLILRGRLDLAGARSLWRELQRVASAPMRTLAIDLAAVESLDGAAAALLVDLRERLLERGVRAEIVGTPSRLSSLVGVYGGYGPPRAPRRRRRALRFIAHLGDEVREAWHEARRTVEFLGDTVVGAVGAVARPVTGHWRSLPGLIVRAGTDAVPLVVLLNFILGFVMGYEASRQLEKYGAQLFIADVIGVAVTRELSPVMTSIVVLGRSAAAFATETGTMKVTEELDALRTMGFEPVRHLVIPRALALLIVTPVLALLGDVAGVVGGALVGVAKLDVTPHAYLTELRQVVVLGDVLGGLLKASVIGVTMALIAGHQGFAATGGPEGVGQRTTSTVVKGLVALVLIDAIFALLLGAIRS